MNETASLNGSSSALAISSDNKRGRKSGGCVGIFFQLFDWNRRFAKKKAFLQKIASTRLVKNRAKEASKKFGGDEKLPKLRLIADENSGGFPNINKNGGSSVNSSNVEPPKDFSGEFRGGGRREKGVVGDDFEKETAKQDFRPQKLQKTERSREEVKHHHNHHNHHHHPKLASPVKNTNHHSRRSSSRLIGAATRILEPQSRNRVKHAITYPHSVRIPVGNELGPECSKGQKLDLLNGQTSCKNCGNLVDIVESTSKREVRASVLDSIVDLSSQVSPNGNSRFNREKEFSNNIDRGRQPHPQNLAFPTYFKENSRRTVDVSDGVPFSSQSRLSCLPSASDSVSDTKDFVALNRSSTGRTRSRTPSKVEDTKFDKRGKFENGLKRPITHVRKQPESCGMIGSSSNNRPPRMVSNGGNKNCDGMTFRFNSSMNMNNRCEMPTKLERRRNPNGATSKTTTRKKSAVDEKIGLQKPFPLTGDSLGAILEEKLKELANQVEYESKRSSANIFQELICALKDRPIAENDLGFSSRRNCFSASKIVDMIRTRALTKSETTGGLIGYKSIDHLSPGSVLEASFSNDSCCSSSLEDSSVRTQHADSMSYSYDESQLLDTETDPFSSCGVKEDNSYDIIADLLTYISEVLSSLLDAGIKESKRAHIMETVFNSELVIGNQVARKPNEPNSFLVCRLLLELETVAEVMRMKFGNFLGSENPKAGYQMKRVVFDSLIEFLDSKYGRYSKCGFRAWMTVPPFVGPEILVHEVMEEVRRWMGFVGQSSDDLVEGDMSRCLGKWTDFEMEGYEIGGRIEGDVVEMLVDEIVADLCCFRV
ncbi:hypothetical protein OSB04_000337 [Centaurea solstitialis]|uniref:DUF4378 domain-containing protein n=1 Tax=Centaurea solstitialis TaxID=347529 RepID=A0AA38TZE8_9ASTR|nr:hypothetical protein OSB04_000337 [Centaurea solstitialis]